MAQKVNEFVSRFGKNPKGVGAGFGALLAAAGLAYGASNSFFTGINFKHKKKSRSFSNKIKLSS